MGVLEGKAAIVTGSARGIGRAGQGYWPSTGRGSCQRPRRGRGGRPRQGSVARRQSSAAT